MSTATGNKTTGRRTSGYSAYIRNPDESMKFAIVLGGVLLMAAFAYVAMAAGWPKFSRAEVFFAECVREMFQTDNMVTPLYHGTPFFDKPILSYWLIACSYKLFGVSHLAARVPSIFAALATVAATALATNKLFGPRAGTLAGAVLASAFMFLSFSNMCMSDMTLVFFDTVTLILLYAGTSLAARARAQSLDTVAAPANVSQPLMLGSDSQSNICFWLASLSAGLAFLTKGPVGIALPGLTYVLYLTITKQWKVLKPVTHVAAGLLIMTLAAVPWFLAAFRENGAGALGYFFIRENLQRFAGSTYDTHRPLWFMLTSLLSGFLPWSIFLPFAFKRSLEHWRGGVNSVEGRKHLFLWLWIATVTVFFSLSRGKIDYYVLPVYPAAAAVVGLYLSEIADRKTLFAKIVGCVLGLLATISGAAAFALFPVIHGLSTASDWFLTPLVLTTGGLGIIYCIRQEQLRKAYKLVCVTICMTAVAFSVQLFPWISSKQAILSYIPIIKSSSSSTKIGLHASVQNWIDEVLFTTGKEATPLKDAAMAGRMLSAPAPALVLIPEGEYYSLPEDVRAHARILDSRPFISHSINPGFLFSSMGKLCDHQLLLVENPPEETTDQLAD